MNIEEIIRAIQKEIGVTVDGKAGPETWQTIYDRIVLKKPPGTAPLDEKVDSRSEGVIDPVTFGLGLILKAMTRGTPRRNRPR